MKTTAERILSVLVELYAKQKGVRIGYTIESNQKEKREMATNNAKRIDDYRKDRRTDKGVLL